MGENHDPPNIRFFWGGYGAYFSTSKYAVLTSRGAWLQRRAWGFTHHCCYNCARLNAVGSDVFMTRANIVTLG